MCFNAKYRGRNLDSNNSKIEIKKSVLPRKKNGSKSPAMKKNIARILPIRTMSDKMFAIQDAVQRQKHCRSNPTF